MNKTGLKIYVGKVFMLGIQTITLFCNLQYFINSIEIYDLLPVLRISPFDHPFNNNSSQSEEVNAFPLVFPK